MRSPGLWPTMIAVTMVACSPSKECDHNGDFYENVDYEKRTFLPGFHLGGFALGSNGRGYLSGVVGFGSCRGEYEGVLFAVDTMTFEAERVEIEFWPGRVTAWPDGDRAFLEEYSPESGQSFGEGSAPPGAESPPWDDLVLAEGDQLTIVEPTVGRFRPAPGGWVASSDETSYFVDYRPAFDPLPATPSHCGAFGTGRYLLCENEAIRIVAQDQSALGLLLLLDELPLEVVGNETVGLVLYSTSAGVIRNDAIESEIGLGTQVQGYRAWLSPDGSEAIVAAHVPVVNRLDLETGTAELISSDLRIRDVLYIGTSAVLSFGEIETSPSGLVRAIPRVLPVPDRFRRGDSLEVIATWNDAAQEWEPWSLVFE